MTWDYHFADDQRGAAAEAKQPQPHCRHECGEYTPRVTAIGEEIFHYTTCRCGTWYMSVAERRRFSLAQRREEVRRGLSPPDDEMPTTRRPAHGSAS